MSVLSVKSVMSVFVRKSACQIERKRANKNRDCEQITPFKNKNGISNGSRRKGGSPTSRSDSDGNPHQSEQSHFLRKTQKMNKGKKKKQLRGKQSFPKQSLAFCRDCERITPFKNKNGISNGSRTHVAGMRTRCPRPLDDGDAFTNTNKIYSKVV